MSKSFKTEYSERTNVKPRSAVLLHALLTALLLLEAIISIAAAPGTGPDQDTNMLQSHTHDENLFSAWKRIFEPGKKADQSSGQVIFQRTSASDAPLRGRRRGWQIISNVTPSAVEDPSTFETEIQLEEIALLLILI